MAALGDERCGRLHAGWAFEHRDKTIVHEVFHATDEVLHDGPRGDGSGHSPDLRDVMYGHTLPRHRVEALEVDPGRDDYWTDVRPWLTRNHHRVHVTVQGGGTILPYPWPNRYLGGTGPCGDDCVLWYRRGTRVVLRPGRNDRSFRFAGWGGACRGTRECDLTAASARRVAATFEKVANLDVQVRGPGVVLVSGRRTCRSHWCGYDYSPGSRATVVAVPGRGARFVRWSSHCGSRARCSVIVRHRRGVTLTALFGRR
jgi:hypothetical protein